METGYAQLTVRFEPPFWTLLYERSSEQGWEACQVTFGAEPKDCEVWDFILKHYYELKFSPAIETELKQTAKNPKRRQRNAKKQLQILGVGTKSQQALQMQREEMKTRRKQTSKEQRETEKRRQFALKLQKRKAKHRGH